MSGSGLPHCAIIVLDGRGTGGQQEGCTRGTDGIAAAPDTGNDVVRELAGLLQHLGPGLAANHGLEVADDCGERVRADGRPDEVVGGADVGHPVLGNREVGFESIGLPDGQSHWRKEGHPGALQGILPLPKGDGVRHTRMASLMASFKVRLPDSTGTTFAPRVFIRNTLSFCRSQSAAPMYTVQSRSNKAHTQAVATPCCPAPVSAMMRFFPAKESRTQCGDKGWGKRAGGGLGIAGGAGSEKRWWGFDYI